MKNLPLHLFCNIVFPLEEGAEQIQEMAQQTEHFLFEFNNITKFLSRKSKYFSKELQQKSVVV